MIGYITLNSPFCYTYKVVTGYNPHYKATTPITTLIVTTPFVTTPLVTTP